MSDKNKFKFEPNNKYFTIVIYGLMFVFGAVIICGLIGNFGMTLKLISDFLSLISPFLIGFFIAFLLHPMVKFFYRRFFTKVLKIKSAKVAKWLSIILTYIIAISVIAILVLFVAPQVYQSIVDITEQIPVWYSTTISFIENFEVDHPELNRYINVKEISQHLENSYPEIIQKVTDIATSLIPKIFTTSVSIVMGIFNFLIAIMSSVYMIADHKNIFYYGKRLLYALVPKKWGDLTLEFCSDCNRIFSSFIYGKAIDSLIIGILCFILMTIFRFPYAVLISVAVGITNMIPVFGPYIGGAVGVIIIIIVNPLQAVFFALLILAIQQFDGLYLGPRILGDSVGLNPLWVIVAITVGGSCFGILGMFLGVPFMAVLAHLLHRIIDHVLNRKNVTIARPDNEDEM